MLVLDGLEEVSAGRLGTIPFLFWMHKWAKVRKARRFNDQLIITSRIGRMTPSVKMLLRFLCFTTTELAPLEHNDIQLLFESITKGPVDVDTLEEALVQWPLMATLSAHHFLSEGLQSLPSRSSSKVSSNQGRKRRQWSKGFFTRRFTWTGGESEAKVLDFVFKWFVTQAVEVLQFEENVISCALLLLAVKGSVTPMIPGRLVLLFLRFINHGLRFMGLPLMPTVFLRNTGSWELDRSSFISAFNDVHHAEGTFDAACRGKLRILEPTVGGRTTLFVHQFVQDYLAARYLLETEPEDDPQQVWDALSASSNSQWDGMDEIRVHVCSIIAGGWRGKRDDGSPTHPLQLRIAARVGHVPAMMTLQIAGELRRWEVMDALDTALAYGELPRALPAMHLLATVASFMDTVNVSFWCGLRFALAVGSPSWLFVVAVLAAGPYVVKTTIMIGLLCMGSCSLLLNCSLGHNPFRFVIMPWIVLRWSMAQRWNLVRAPLVLLASIGSFILGAILGFSCSFLFSLCMPYRSAILARCFPRAPRAMLFLLLLVHTFALCLAVWTIWAWPSSNLMASMRG